MNKRHGLYKKCGVYLLTCKQNGKRYVGSSINLGSRLNQHFGKTCVNRYKDINELYADISKYGREGFDIDVLEFCKPEDKYETERKWYHKLSPEYNLIEPDEHPLLHKEVQEKSKQACLKPEAITRRLASHRSEKCRQACREVQRHRMVRCKATNQNGSKEFESLSEAARWLNREAKQTCVITHIRYAIQRKGTAYGYRWEVVKDEGTA